MTMTKKRKIVVSCAITPVLLLLAGFVFLSSRTSQTELRAQFSDGQMGCMPLSGRPIFLEVSPGLKFKVDTGSDLSFITEEDLAYLKSHGCDVEEMIYPVLGRDGIGDIQFNVRRYRVSIPFHKYECELDSMGHMHYVCDRTSVNMIHNVDFAPSETGFSVLGMDFLEKFDVEYLQSKNMLAFYFEPPMDYEACAELSVSKSPLDWIYPGHRYYMDIEIDHSAAHNYLDTGVQRAFVKMPTKRAKNMDNMVRDSISSMRGTYPALIDTAAWLSIGNREGVAYVYYYTNDEEDYAINPLNIFKLDILMDFPGRRIMMRR